MLLCATLTSSPAFAQTGPIHFNTDAKQLAEDRVARAVIVGVSHYNYLDSAIQLHYAHKDAEDFRDLLIKSGVHKENIWCRTNDDVPDERVVMGTFTDFAAATDQNDLLIFYFSGHGDLQIKSDPKKPKGYLLLQNVQPKQGPYYKTGDALPIDRIRDEAAAIDERGGQVLVIIDACRKGKFPSTEENSNITSAALNTPWSTNVSKLISCKPDQKSFEFGTPYNHGVFTYYLLKGIEGAADTEHDDKIFFNELEAYLRASVGKITKSQTPDTYSFNSDLFLFNRTGAAKSGATPGNEKPGNNALLGKSIHGDDELPNAQPSATQALEELFELFIDERKLLMPLDPAERDNERTVLRNTQISNKVHAGNATAIAFSPDGESFATVGEDKNLLLWGLDCQLSATIPYAGNGASVCYSPDGRYIAIGTWGQRIQIVDVARKAIVSRKNTAATDHQQDIRALAFSSDGSLLASGGYDTDIKIWETKTWTQVGKTLSDHTQKISGLVFTTNGKGLVSLGTEGELISWNLETFTKIGPTVPTGLNVTGVQLMADGNAVVAGSRNGDLLRFRLSLPVNEWKKTRVPGIKECDAFAADMFGFMDLWGSRTIRVYGSDRGNLFQELPLNQKIRAMKVDKTGRYLAGVDFNGHVFLSRIWLPYAYASEVYDLLDKQADAAPAMDHYRNRFTTALESSVLEIIKPFVTGEQKLPNVPAIREARRKLEYVEKINAGNTRALRRVKCDKLLLEVFEILQSSEVSRFADAAKKLQEVIALEPDEAYHINILGGVYQRLNEIEKARAQISQASDRMPLWIVPLIDMTRSYFSEGQYDQALQQCRKVVNIAPELPHGYACRADIEAFLGRYPAAQRDLDTASSIDSLKPYVLNMKAKLALERGNIPVALKILNKSLDADDAFFRTDLLLGDAYFFRYLNGGATVDDIQKAYDAYWRAVTREPQNPDVLIALVNFYEQLGGLPNVDEVLQRVPIKRYMSGKPPSGASRRTAPAGGMSAAETTGTMGPMGLYAEIQKLSDLVVSKAPFDPDAYAASGYALYGAARTKLPYEKKKMINQAEERFKESIAKCPDNAKAYANYADFLMTTRNYKEANKAAQKSVSKDALYWRAYYLVARSYLMMDKGKDAIDFLNNALKYDSGPLIEYQIALIQKKTDQNAYKEHLQKALEKDPDFFFATEMLRNAGTALVKY